MGQGLPCASALGPRTLGWARGPGPGPRPGTRKYVEAYNFLFPGPLTETQGLGKHTSGFQGCGCGPMPGPCLGPPGPGPRVQALTCQNENKRVLCPRPAEKQVWFPVMLSTFPKRALAHQGSGAL